MFYGTIDQPTEQISTMFLILISFAFPSHLSDGQILIKLLAKKADQNKVICFNDDSETAYIDYVIHRHIILYYQGKSLVLHNQLLTFILKYI